MGCVKVKDDKGARLLSGREADAFRANLASEPTSYRLTVRQREAALLTDLSVLPGARRLGLGRALCERCADLAHAWGYADVFLLVNAANAPARKLYREMGFVEEGTRNLATEEVASLTTLTTAAASSASSASSSPSSSSSTTASTTTTITMETVEVENLLMSLPLTGSNSPQARRDRQRQGGASGAGGGGGSGSSNGVSGGSFKLGASNRKEELERKQLIGHVIPAVAFAACFVPQLVSVLQK